MKRQSGILAGTALGLLMASTPLSALPLSAPEALPVRADALTLNDARIILAQAQTEEEEEEQQQTEEQPAEEQPQAQQEEQPAEEAPAEQAAPAEEAPAEEQQAAPEAPAEDEAPAQAETTEPAAEDAPAEQQAAPEAPAEDAPAQAETDAPADEPAAEETAEEPAADEAPAERQAAPEGEQDPAQAETDAPADDPAAADEATGDEPASEDTAEPATDEAPAEQQAAPEAEQEQDPAQAETDAPTDEPAAEETAEEPATDEAPADDTAGDQPADGDEPAEQQATPDGEQDPAQADADQPNTGEEAPILDSAKEAPADAEGTQPEGQAAGEQDQQQRQRRQATTPPESDADAQANIQVEEIEPVTAEQGERLEIQNTREARREARRERRERRENARVVREFDDNRVIVEFGNQVFIESPDYERIIFEDDEVYYEALPRGRTREVIIRQDGSRVVTIRNRYGDIVRRSRILPDDREIVLVYVEDRYYDEVLAFRDPGASLPPLQLTIPREEYILEAETVESPDAYYAFFDQPPVDQLERTYSVEEVKRSARIRDTVRRVDLDTINFEFGSAEITESEIDELQGVAEAIQRLLDENPAETFLIEGHTDAVGTDLANLALSDRRAEAVATALTQSFDIPPENLVTQGYGEQYLKIETTEPERENRRVAMRRITPLVKPVASAE